MNAAQMNKTKYGMRIIARSHPMVVVHTPKCGGTSLFVTLRKTFGADEMFIEYTKVNPTRAKAPLHRHSVIYGHFPALKYGHLDNAMWVTLLREPVDRLLSLYFAWRFYPVDLLRNKPDALRLAVSQNQISLIDFAKNMRISQTYHRRFFGGFDMNRFELIILTDHYAEGVRRLSEKIGVPLQIEHKNVSSARSLDYKKARQEILDDTAMLQQLRGILRKEIEFYEMCAQLPATAR